MFLFLWMRWLRSRKVLYFFFISISSIVYPVSFATIAFGITIWIPVGLYVLFELIEHRSDRKVVFRILFQFLIGCTFWVIVNIWWIFPLLTNTASTLLQMGNFDNLAILKGVSQYFKNRDVLLLRQSYYFSENNINEQFRSGFYLSPQAYLLSLIALVFVTIGAFTSFGKKYFKYLTVLLILSWFLIKGANRPFGVEFYGFLFSKLSVLQMFRNPYEKLGLMFVVPYTIFFSLGVHLIGQKLKRFKMLFFGLTIFFICGVLVWPMWTGKVYADFVRLKIPQEYEEINQLINMDKSDVRILNLPPINGEGSRFSWGYEGVVPYDFLFDKPTIARNIFVGSYYQEIFDAFSDSDISKIDATLDNLNIRYLILHKDMDFTFNGSLDPKIVEKIINNSQNFEFITSIGNLSLYKYVSNNVGTRITAFPHVSLEFSYEIKSPTKYVVKVTNAKKPYKLIFKESFHENWEARIGNEKIAQHFKPYDYANGWEISKLGSYDIVIVFKIWPWD
ncbi:hypothetical protein HY385_00385 [Candidatus Daviesbacteria bacterium]|nr:hypothetical protein [Candidatus Daviesbacteria bacterium]